jgi:hypothetical protein
MRSPADLCQCQWLTCNFEARLGCTLRAGLECPLAGEAGPTRTRTRTPSRWSYPRGRRRTDQKHKPICSRAAGPPLESGSSDRRLRLGAGVTVLVGALGLDCQRYQGPPLGASIRRVAHAHGVSLGQSPAVAGRYLVVSRACSANKAQAIARCWDRSFPGPIALPHGHRGEWAAMPTSAPRYVPESPDRGRTTPSRSCF